MKKTTLSLALGSALLLAVSNAASGQRAGAGGTGQSAAGAGGTGQSPAGAGGTGQRTTVAPAAGIGAASQSAPTTQGPSQFSDPLGPGDKVPLGSGFRPR